MPRAELLKTIWRMYSTIQSARWELQKVAQMSGGEYWHGKGVGARSLEKMRQVLAPLEKQYGGDEAIHGALLGRLHGLLFDTNGFEGLETPAVCSACGFWGRESQAGQSCDTIRINCVGTFQLLTWESLDVPSVRPGPKKVTRSVDQPKQVQE